MINIYVYIYLGRVACLPYVPVFSLIFSFLSIVKTIFQMNIQPLVAGNITKIPKNNTSRLSSPKS